MPDTIADKLKENAQGPAQVQGDEGSVRQHSLREQIEADQYLRSINAGKRRKPPIRIGRIIPGGAA